MRSAAHFDPRPARTATAGLRIWLRRTSARVRPVCWPWCDAGAGMFRQMADTPLDSMQGLAMQFPSREGRYSEPPQRRLDTITQAIIAALASQSDCRPLVFCLQRWAGFTSGPFETRLWPIGHFYLVDQGAELTRRSMRWIDCHPGTVQ